MGRYDYKNICMFFSMPFYAGDSFILKACGRVYIILCSAYEKSSRRHLGEENWKNLAGKDIMIC